MGYKDRNTVATSSDFHVDEDHVEEGTFLITRHSEHSRWLQFDFDKCDITFFMDSDETLEAFKVKVREMLDADDNREEGA